MSLEQQKSIFLILKPYKTSLKLLGKKSHNLHCLSHNCPVKLLLLDFFAQKYSAIRCTPILAKTSQEKTDFLQKNRAPHNRETTVYQFPPAHFPEILFVTYMYCVWAFEVVES